MDTNTAPKLTFSQRALLDKIGRVLKKAKRRGVIPFYKTYWRSEVAFLETQENGLPQGDEFEKRIKQAVYVSAKLAAAELVLAKADGTKVPLPSMLSTIDVAKGDKVTAVGGTGGRAFHPDASGAELGRALPFDRVTFLHAIAVFRQHMQYGVGVAVLELHHLAFDGRFRVGVVHRGKRVMRKGVRRSQRGDCQ